MAFATITASTENDHRIGAAEDAMHGYHGRILHVNLTNGEYRKNKTTFTQSPGVLFLAYHPAPAGARAWGQSTRPTPAAGLRRRAQECSLLGCSRFRLANVRSSIQPTRAAATRGSSNTLADEPVSTKRPD